jgi:hypothetical protein
MSFGVRSLSKATCSSNALPKHPGKFRNVALSTVHRGIAFEDRSLKLLQDSFSMSLRSVGGKSDGGIDLMGWWWLPEPFPSASGTISSSGESSIHKRRRLRVLAQCKAEKKKFSPNYVREMEGVLYRYLASSKELLQSSFDSHAQDSTNYQTPLSHHPSVALLVSESQFTSSTILRAQSSPVPFCLLYIPPLPSAESSGASDEHQQTGIGTALWNPALGGDRGLLGGRMEVRWERSIKNGGVGRPGLWWDGKKLEHWIPQP